MAVLRSWGRVRPAGLVVAVLAALCLPSTAAAVTVKPAPVPARLLTVDHPPVDGIRSFDNGPRDSGRVALTFDADMTSGMLAQLRAGQVRSWYNQEVRDVLDAEKVPATIFLTGLWAQAYPEVARSLAVDPLFEIGDHTYDHLAFRTPCYGLPAAGDRDREITLAQDEIAGVIGFRPTLLRFPGDCYDGSDVARAAGLGLSVISGDVRGGDAFNGSAGAVAATVLAGARGGSIVILHLQGGANAPMTAPALRIIIPALRARGLSFTTVSELLGRARPVVHPRWSTSMQVLGPLRSQQLTAPLERGAVLALAAARRRPLAPPQLRPVLPSRLIP